MFENYFQLYVLDKDVYNIFNCACTAVDDKIIKGLISKFNKNNVTQCATRFAQRKEEGKEYARILSRDLGEHFFEDTSLGNQKFFDEKIRNDILASTCNDSYIEGLIREHVDEKFVKPTVEMLEFSEQAFTGGNKANDYL